MTPPSSNAHFPLSALRGSTGGREGEDTSLFRVNGRPQRPYT